MRVSDLERLYDYNYWANKQLIGVVSRLTPEQFTQPVAGSYGSVRNTLVGLARSLWWSEARRAPEPPGLPDGRIAGTSVESCRRTHARLPGRSQG